MTPSAKTRALLLFAHGSSDPRWAEPFVKLQSVIRQHDPAQIVELAYLERMKPSFDEAVATLQAQGVQQITVAPIFLALGGHLRKDLPDLVHAAQQRTGIDFQVLPALGEAEMLIESIATWVCSASASRD